MWVKLIVTRETWFKADLPSSFFPRGYPDFNSGTDSSGYFSYAFVHISLK